MIIYHLLVFYPEERREHFQDDEENVRETQARPSWACHHDQPWKYAVVQSMAS